MPFPIQRFHTDNGHEFTAYDVQDLLTNWGIKFRPICPASLHLNGKVERVQKIVLSEFYATIELPVADLHVSKSGNYTITGACTQKPWQDTH